MRRCIVFVHYDNQNIIENYVIYYLKELKKYADDIVFVSACNLSEHELNKISNITIHSIALEHGEYDFGSYKRGYLYLKEKGLLDSFDEILFVNDSCFGPVVSLDNVFDKFNDCDFWGMNKNSESVSPHVQSFFMAFKKNVILSDVFDNFMSSIKKENTKEDIIAKYEINLSKILTNAGFKYKTVFQTPIDRKISGTLFFLKEINPLIKICTLKKGTPDFINFLFRNFLRNKSYPVELISEFLKNKSIKGSPIDNLSIFIKLIFRLQTKRKRFYFFGKWYYPTCFPSNRKMKLGISYNLFDGEELLEASVKSVRDEAYHINVVWQKESYYGNPCNPNLEETLLSLKDKGLIDSIYCYETNFKKHKKKHKYERKKRNIGLKIAKKAGCTHFLSMDTDEFYDKEQLKKAKEFIMKRGIKASACSIIEYMTEPVYKILNGPSYSPEENYNYYVPFIMKINRFLPQHHGGRKFPCTVDPTRRLNNSSKFYLFSGHEVIMHHMANVRKDLEKKFKNSNYNTAPDNMKEKINKLKSEIINWDFEKNRLGDSKYSLFQDKIVEKTENKFNIDIRGN